MMEHDLQIIGSKIYAARKNKNLNQEDICDMIDIRQSTFSRLESGQYDIPYTKLVKLCEILDISISWLSGENSLPQLTDRECLELEEYRKFLISKRK